MCERCQQQFPEAHELLLRFNKAQQQCLDAGLKVYKGGIGLIHLNLKQQFEVMSFTIHIGEGTDSTESTEFKECYASGCKAIRSLLTDFELLVPNAILVHKAKMAAKS